MTSQKLVDWYVSNRTFDNFKGNKRNEILDLSSKEFFSELKKEAKGGEKLQLKDYDKIIKNAIENDVNVWFNEKLRIDIENSNLPIPDMKEDLLRNISSYDSEIEVQQDINSGQDYIEGLKDRFKGAQELEERQLAEEELRAEAPAVYRGLRSGESRASGRALRYVLGE